MKGRGGEKDREMERGGGGEDEDGEGEERWTEERRMEGEEAVHVTGSAECIHTILESL